MNSLFVKLVFVAVLMFGFGYAMVPLYEAFCRITGFGGKTLVIDELEARAEQQQALADALDREIAVSFTTHSNSSLPWEFKPLTHKLVVKPGEMNDAVFYVRNMSNRAITGMATFNVTPPRAGMHFKKTECFCFSQQTLQAGEEQEMVVRFLLDQDLPEDVHELTLSYTFFDNEKYAAR